MIHQGVFILLKGGNASQLVIRSYTNIFYRDCEGQSNLHVGKRQEIERK